MPKHKDPIHLTPILALHRNDGAQCDFSALETYQQFADGLDVGIRMVGWHIEPALPGYPQWPPASFTLTPVYSEVDKSGPSWIDRLGPVFYLKRAYI